MDKAGLHGGGGGGVPLIFYELALRAFIIFVNIYNIAANNTMMTTGKLSELISSPCIWTIIDNRIRSQKCDIFWGKLVEYPARQRTVQGLC